MKDYNYAEVVKNSTSKTSDAVSYSSKKQEMVEPTAKKRLALKIVGGMLTLTLVVRGGYGFATDAQAYYDDRAASKEAYQQAMDYNEIVTKNIVVEVEGKKHIINYNVQEIAFKVANEFFDSSKNTDLNVLIFNCFQNFENNVPQNMNELFAYLSPLLQSRIQSNPEIFTEAEMGVASCTSYDEYLKFTKSIVYKSNGTIDYSKSGENLANRIKILIEMQRLTEESKKVYETYQDRLNEYSNSFYVSEEKSFGGK